MNESISQEDRKRNTIEVDNREVKEVKTLKQRISSWLGFFAMAAVMLFFFAPESWWQFGVAPTEERKSTANFTLGKLSGGDWKFSDQRGKVVVVNYRATWCPPCRIETPGLVNFGNEYRS